MPVADPFLTCVFFICVALTFLFVFINGFHDTANAVTTVIYTGALPPALSVGYSGILNFAGALAGGGAVALSIAGLVPEGVFSNASGWNNFALILAVLISAIAWNLGSWYFGIPSSSSHALIGALLGIGISSKFGNDAATENLSWTRVGDSIFYLLCSPLLGFLLSLLIMLVFRRAFRNPDLFEEPVPGKRPPVWIRSILLVTCGAVSFVHGQNDGQKGAGLLMLVFLAAAPLGIVASPVLPDYFLVGIAVCIGTGTMIGWKRIVRTMGEKIGRRYMSFAQGASAELVAAGGIGIANAYGISVSTTHMVTTGIAGSMVAEKGWRNLQRKTLWTILLVWLLTLPVTALASSVLFLLMKK
jgi:phosphate/sulfate permease